MDNKKELATTPKKEVAIKEGIDNLLASRKYFIEQVLPILKDNQDFYEIKGKKSLAKGGAEKLASIFKLTAKFEIDNEVKQALGNIPGLVAFKCILSKGDEFIGQGGGADTLGRNQNDPNKTIKMAQKRAYIDAVIRATGLSDIFTQDLEDMSADKISPAKDQPKDKTWIKDPNAPISEKQLGFLRKLIADIGKDESWFVKKTNKYTQDLTKGEASVYIDQMTKMKEKMHREAENVPTVDENGEIINDAEISEMPADMPEEFLK